MGSAHNPMQSVRYNRSLQRKASYFKSRKGKIKLPEKEEDGETSEKRYVSRRPTNSWIRRQSSRKVWTRQIIVLLLIAMVSLYIFWLLYV